MSSSPPRQWINELKDGDVVDEVFMLADKQLRANRNADMYLLSQLKDKTGQLSGLMWNVREEAMAKIEAGSYVQIRGKIQLFQGNLQLILNYIAPYEGSTINEEDFISQPSHNTAEIMEKLNEKLLSFREGPLLELAKTFLNDEALVQSLSQAPAGIKAHHPYQGGLVEHIVNLMEVADAIIPFYPQLDRDLLVMGVFLHDLAKIRELEYESVFAYTDEGQLLGHLVIAVEMLSDKIKETEANSDAVFSEELTLRLKHMIVSHHGSYEFGSPKLPMTPEAIALHQLDNLDAKLNEFSILLDADMNHQSNWTPFHPRLNRKLYKGQQGSTNE